ncbi:MAG TPA: hypothetical protein VJ976_03425 [Ornithinimicrobium sp.]|uniref:hypothetical protein n=1 Tax=Ornithinimicrobium sp. TaxID=1977084 RepID=UPI002B46297D|nr:hypothetical protein [Ornithinimicrobium sp.]HKJ11421.1 hypothetical protein [Ornithinimicrobium sp.]
MSSDELNLRPDAGKAQYPEDAAAPQQVVEAEAFVARHAEVLGFGLGVADDGDPCMILFAETFDDDKVPETLDGLPVRVEKPGPFAEGT